MKISIYVFNVAITTEHTIDFYLRGNEITFAEFLDKYINYLKY